MPSCSDASAPLRRGKIRAVFVAFSVLFILAAWPARVVAQDARGSKGGPTEGVRVVGVQANPDAAPPITPTPSIATIPVPSSPLPNGMVAMAPIVAPAPDDTHSNSLGTNVNPTQPSLASAGGDGVLRLRLILHELVLLQKAAREAGGDLRISIDPVGITTEDLVVPLARDPELLVQRDRDVIVVSTRSPDAVAQQIRQEIQKLEDRRRALLQDVTVLERLSSGKQQAQ